MAPVDALLAELNGPGPAGPIPGLVQPVGWWRAPLPSSTAFIVRQSKRRTARRVHEPKTSRLPVNLSHNSELLSRKISPSPRSSVQVLRHSQAAFRRSKTNVGNHRSHSDCNAPGCFPARSPVTSLGGARFSFFRSSSAGRNLRQ